MARRCKRVAVSSLYLEKSDFLRLSNLRLGNTFTFKQFPWIQSLNIYVSAQNLFTITNYSGYCEKAPTQLMKFTPALNFDDPNQGVFTQQEINQGVRPFKLHDASFPEKEKSRII